MLNRWNPDRRAFGSDESGMSLVEILVAVFILAVAVIAIASTAAASLQSVRESRNRQDATQFASTVLEEIRALPFSDVALDETTIDTVAVPDFEGEDILAAPGGEVPHTQTNGNQTATTYITVIPGTDSAELRATVLVTWGDVDGEHTVRQETRIAEATRGLPVPSFTVNPTATEGSGVPGETICVDHELTNLGEQDGYSWQLFATNSSSGELEPATYVPDRKVSGPDGSGETGSLTRDGFKVPGSSDGAHWFGWALMRIPDGSGDWVPMDELTGDSRPDSHAKVLALADADVRFCYTALNTAGDLEATDTSLTLTPRIYSAFDESVNTKSQGNELSNTLNVEPRIVLHLREIDGTPKTMTVAPPENTDESTDYDGDLIPGLHLDGGFNPTTWTANTGSFGFPSDSFPRDLSNPSVIFHVRTDDDTGKELIFDLRLSLLREGASTPEILSTLDDLRVSPVTTVWQAVSGSLALSTSPVSVGDNDTLILEIVCDTGPCHIHYDVTTLDSWFSADFQ